MLSSPSLLTARGSPCCSAAGQDDPHLGHRHRQGGVRLAGPRRERSCALLLASDGRTLAKRRGRLRHQGLGHRATGRDAFTARAGDGEVRPPGICAHQHAGQCRRGQDGETVDTSTGAPPAHAGRAHAAVCRLAFSPLGTTLVSGGQDKTTRTSGTPQPARARGVLRNHRDAVVLPSACIRTA